MRFEEPKVEFVAIDLNDKLITGSNCIADGKSGQGGTSCIGDADHSSGVGCGDTAALIGG